MRILCRLIYHLRASSVDSVSFTNKNFLRTNKEKSNDVVEVLVNSYHFLDD